MKLACKVQNPDTLGVVRQIMPKLRIIVQSTAEAVAAHARSLAPAKTGALRRGIMASPWEENSVKPYKIGRQIYMDSRMNDTFVKTRKDGKRYYYPASQEHGFLSRNRTGETRHVDGKYFLKCAATTGYAAFYADVQQTIEEAVSD